MQYITVKRLHCIVNLLGHRYCYQFQSIHIERLHCISLTTTQEYLRAKSWCFRSWCFRSWSNVVTLNILHKKYMSITNENVQHFYRCTFWSLTFYKDKFNIRSFTRIRILIWLFSNFDSLYYTVLYNVNVITVNVIGCL